MTGKELKTKILEAGFELKKVAESLGITPQDLNSKLKAQSIKTDFLTKIESVINKSVHQPTAQPQTVDNTTLILELIKEMRQDRATINSTAAAAIQAVNNTTTLIQGIKGEIAEIKEEAAGVKMVQTGLLEWALLKCAQVTGEDPAELRKELGRKMASVAGLDKKGKRAVQNS